MSLLDWESRGPNCTTRAARQCTAESRSCQLSPAFSAQPPSGGISSFKSTNIVSSFKAWSLAVNLLFRVSEASRSQHSDFKDSGTPRNHWILAFTYFNTVLVVAGLRLDIDETMSINLRIDITDLTFREETSSVEDLIRSSVHASMQQSWNSVDNGIQIQRKLFFWV